MLLSLDLQLEFARVLRESWREKEKSRIIAVLRRWIKY